VDKRADIWSFGVVLFEMLTGKRLFDGETISYTLADVLRAEIDFAKLPKETPAPIRSLLRRCLDRDVKTRLRDIGEARVAVQNVGREPEAPLATDPPQSRFGWLAWSLAGLFLVTTLGLSLVHFRERASEPQVFEYALPAPEGTRLDEFTLSPDGRYLVMRAVGERGAQLWLHALDTLQTQPLPGTDDGAAYPFWSTDSNFIGFFAGRKLKKIAVTGGPVQTLYDAPSGRGGTWNQDGVIVFAASNAGGLSRVPATGGVPTQVMEGSGLRFPVFLPDGHRFLYEAPAEDQGIYLGSLDSKEHHRIMASLSTPAYQPPRAGDHNAYVMFVSESTLVAQPVDPKSLDRTGDAFPVAEQLTSSNRYKDSYSIAPSSSALVYRTGPLSSQQLTWLDRQGRAIAKIGDPAPYDDVAVSPDGTQIAARSNGNIWLIDASRGGRTRFTFGPGRSQSPVWSPDGHRIAFRIDRGGVTELDQKASNGTSEAELLLAPDQHLFKTPSSWSPDGSLLLYDVSDAKTKGDLWALPLGGERKPSPVLRTEFIEGHGLFSPDGRWFAYQSDESGRLEVYVRPFSPDSVQVSSSRDKTSGKWIISKNGGEPLRWLKKELIYVTPDRKIISADVSTTPVFRAGEPQFLFQLPAGASADVTTDGARFLVTIPAEEKQSTQLIVVTNWLARLKK
jgi:Tol biopolymer transport system component